jgi:hypothetical protein
VRWKGKPALYAKRVDLRCQVQGILKRESVLLHDEASGFKIDLTAVAVGDLGDCLGGEAIFPERMHLAEGGLEAAGGDDLKDARRSVSGVPEGVPLPSGRPGRSGR